MEGFYCCVYTCVYSRQLPCDIINFEQAQISLLPQIEIKSEREKARLVAVSIPEKISPAALDLVETVFLSCLKQKEIAILRFLLLGYQHKAEIMSMLSHPVVAPLLEAERHLRKEASLLKGFIRFSDYDGVLAAAITPKNFVLPLIARHFISRFSEEDFLIFDRTHKAALIYQNRRSQFISLDQVEFPAPNANELHYRQLWKQFYRTIAIEARYNPKCRMTMMPKRYWENMTEMKELL